MAVQKAAAALCALWLQAMQLLVAALSSGLKAAVAARTQLEDLAFNFCSVPWLVVMENLGYSLLESAWFWLIVGAKEVGKTYLSVVDWLHKEFARELANPRQVPPTLKTYPGYYSPLYKPHQPLNVRQSRVYEPEPPFRGRQSIFRDSSMFSASQLAFREPQYSSRYSSTWEGQRRMGVSLPSPTPQSFSSWRMKHDKAWQELAELDSSRERLNDWDRERNRFSGWHVNLDLPRNR